MLEIILMIGFGLAFVLFFLLLRQAIEKKFKDFNESLRQDKSLNILSQSVEGLRSRVERSAEVMGQVARELGIMQEIGRDMKKMQDFFQSPKLRGNLGEQVLRDLLKQVLPGEVFAIQYKFQGGEVVDAIIKTSQGLVPIDSKFPMSNFSSRDIKQHIISIAKKYILPQEGTVDFAVMYVPSETVYYQLISEHQELLEYGYQNKVYLVSPNNFYYFLKVIMIGLEGSKIEEASRLILSGLKAIEQESGKLASELSVLNRHLTNAKTAGERALIQFQSLESKINNVSFHKLKNNSRSSLR